MKSTNNDPNPSSSSAVSWCDQHPWLFVALAFFILLGAWTSMIFIAVKHAPARIEPFSHTQHR